MDNPGDISQEGEQDVEPEMFANTHLHENTHGGKNNRDKNFYQFHKDAGSNDCLKFICRLYLFFTRPERKIMKILDNCYLGLTLFPNLFFVSVYRI